MGPAGRLLELLLLGPFWRAACQSDEQGKTVTVEEVVLDSAVVDIQYFGNNHENTMVITKNKRLYTSSNTGKSFTEITEKLSESSSMSVLVERIIVNPTDKQIVVVEAKGRRGSDFGSSGTANWKPLVFLTEDTGRTWRRLFRDVSVGRLHSWVPHPTKPRWALVSWWRGNCKGSSGASVADSGPCVHSLQFTGDLGRTLQPVTDYVVQFSWGSAAVGQENRAYFTSYREQRGDQGSLSVWSTEVDLRACDIRGGETLGRVGRKSEILRHGNKFLVAGEFLLVAKVSSEMKQTVHLMVSKNGGSSFRTSMLPDVMGELEESWYTILDTSEGAVMLHINSEKRNGQDTGRVYVSDAEGYKFTQSLEGNVRSSRGECEFDKVVSLNGVYIANIVPPDAESTPAERDAGEDFEEEASAGAETEKKHGRGWGERNRPKASKTEGTIRTVISLDKGGAWSYLKPPRVDSKGKQIECEGRSLEQCSLHLHGTTSWDMFAPFYSMESAVGIIMGTGNVGNTLRFEPEETNTFLSRDGGLTWMEAHKRPYIYEFGDHGGLIVMADDLRKTAQVVFSWNEGQSWYDFQVSSVPFEVDNIITEPNVTSTSFIMFGTRSEGVGILYFLRFDSLIFPACKGLWAADSVSSDYETWTASDGVSTDKCLLGQQVTYTRRKRTSQCFNGEKMERPTLVKNCACTQEDYVCDIGFVRSLGSLECKYGGDSMMPTALKPATCSGTFTRSAYRKVAGDRCEGGWEPSPVAVPCPSGRSGGNNETWAFGAIVLLAVVYWARGGNMSPPSLPVSSPAKAPKQDIFGDAGSGFSPASLLAPVLGIIGWMQSKMVDYNPGFDSYSGVKYQQVGRGNEESLTDFIDEAEYDDHAPRVYGGALDAGKAVQQAEAEDASPRREPRLLPGGSMEATEDVPRIQAPPAAAAASAPLAGLAASDSPDDLL